MSASSAPRMGQTYAQRHAKSVSPAQPLRPRLSSKQGRAQEGILEGSWATAMVAKMARTAAVNCILIGDWREGANVVFLCVLLNRSVVLREVENEREEVPSFIPVEVRVLQ